MKPVNKARINPKTQTTLAPVGKSRKYDTIIPKTLARNPIAQPSISLVFT